MVTSGTKSAPDLQQILKGAQLAALPQSAMRLLELSKDPDNGPAEFALPIESDPGLTGQVLKFVNSSYFGFSREISSVRHAISLVGIRTIKNFALWSAVFSLMPNPKCGPFDLKSLWQDSLRRALFARAMAKQLGAKEAEEAFAAALLQDMAVPLLAKELATDYLEMLNSRHCGRRLSELERERFGWTHADAAAQMARNWNMPDAFAVLVEQHTALEELLGQKEVPAGPVAVALSALLPASSDEQWSDREAFEAAYNRLRPATGASIEAILAQVDQEFAEFAPVLKLAAPAKSLVAWYQERSATA
jgi:HD-like signal output (HDOD) protein